MKTQKKLVLVTGLFAVLFLGGSVAYKVMQPPIPIVLNTQGQPAIGSGKVQIVVFEDFCCTNCRVFTENVFPEITRLYVNTGKAQLVLIPVAFGENSKSLANAALSVYRIAPKRFVDFVHQLSHAQAASKEDILFVARAVGGIDLAALEERIDQQAHYIEIDRNLLWARSVLGEDFGTPTLLINGIEIPAGSLKAITEKLLEIDEYDPGIA